MRDFGFSGVEEDERKLPNESGRYRGWDDAELEKRRGNLGTEDGVGSLYKNDKTFHIKS